MVGLLAALLIVAPGPPRAYLDTGSKHVPLTVVSWCWDTKCGAPFIASQHTAVIARGALGRVLFAFAPSSVHVAIGGVRTPVALSGSEISWRATRGGGTTIQVAAKRGWVTYVTRIRLRS